ncbi:MAG TPA: DMT family transporter, partial [Bacteroidales bacterium]|nr:DMT family transporter [Bacteroidales bacterium]
MDRTKASYIYAGLAIFFWSTIPTAFKISLGELAILPVLTIASITSTIVLLIIIISCGNFNMLRKTSASEAFCSAILGLINPFLYYLILLKAYQLLPAQVAQPLNMIWPIILVFLSVPILKQKIKRKSFVALFISFAGVYIISSQGEPFSHNHADLTGVIMATGSSVFWAFYFILNVRDKRDEAVKLFLNFLFGSVYLVAAMAFTGGWQNTIGIMGALSSVYIGLFEMGITFFFWLKALKLASSTDKVSNLVYIAPFFS